MLDSAGSEPAHAVGACATGKPPVQGHADVWGGGGGAPRVTLRHCRGCSASSNSARVLLQPVTLRELCEWGIDRSIMN